MDQIFLPVAGQPLQNASKFLTGFAETHQIASELTQSLLIIADELISNTIKYGEAEEVRLALDLGSEKQLTLIYSDDGNPFNPLAADSPDLDTPVEDRDIGGLGLMMVQSMTETQEYERTDDLNVLVLTLRID